MPYPSIFDAATLEANKERLDKLTHKAQPIWGKMDVAQMLHHLNLTYDYALGKKDPKLSGFMKLMLKTFVKKTVVSDKPYKKDTRTAPFFLVADEKDFEVEKKALLSNMKSVFEQGEKSFEAKPTPSFGKLSSKEWNNLFQKHLDHHFKQFGV